jgi:hypothetical protein
MLHPADRAIRANIDVVIAAAVGVPGSFLTCSPPAAPSKDRG